MADRHHCQAAVVAALTRFSQLAADAEGLYDELEINPLIASATGAVAVDVRMLPAIARPADGMDLVDPD